MQAELRELQMELAGVCNVACSYCNWRDRTVGRQLMDIKLALSLLRQAADLLPRPLATFHGLGEATMHPDLVKILDFAESAGLDTRLSTNCSLLSGELARQLANLRRLNFCLSIHYGLPAKTKEQCVVNALDYLALRPQNRQVEILTVADEPTARAAPWFVETFMPSIERLPNARLHFKQPQTWPKAPPVKGIVPDLPPHARLHLDTVATPRSLARGCTMPYYMLNVLADGTTTPCCVGQDDWGLPSAKDTPIATIWTSPRMEEIRQLWNTADDAILCGPCIKRTDS